MPFFRRAAPVGATPPSSPNLRRRSLFQCGAFFAGALVALNPQTARAEIERSVDRDGVITLSNLGARHTPRRAEEPFSRAELERRRELYREPIAEAARQFQVPEALLLAVIHVESNFNPSAVSHARAQGLMQLIPETAERMLVSNVFDPRQNILGGARYLRLLADRFGGNIRLTLAAYNAGEGSVERHGGVPPYPETQAYVSRVLGFYNLYRHAARS
jgi:soluble lytic murein transglycosylase-like protein